MRLSPRLRLILVAVVVFFVILFVTGYFFSLSKVNEMFARPNWRGEPFVISTPTDSTVERLSLVSSDGIPIEAWWITSPRPSRGIVVLVPGINDDVASFLPHFMFLYNAGYRILAVNLRVHGGSSGDRISLGINEPRDVIAALNWLQRRTDLKDQPIILLGHSMGGVTAIRAAAGRPEVDAVISISAFSSIDAMIDHQLAGLPGFIQPILHLDADLAFLSLYGVWPASASASGDIARVTPRPLFLIHGDADQSVLVNQVQELYAAAGRKAKLWIVPGGSHTFFFKDNDPALVNEFRSQILAFLDTEILR